MALELAQRTRTALQVAAGNVRKCAVHFYAQELNSNLFKTEAATCSEIFTDAPSVMHGSHQFCEVFSVFAEE